MGDRVAVLRFGKLQQFASPNELYDQPGQRVRRRLHRIARDEPGDRCRSPPTASRSATRRWNSNATSDQAQRRGPVRGHLRHPARATRTHRFRRRRGRRRPGRGPRQRGLRLHPRRLRTSSWWRGATRARRPSWPTPCGCTGIPRARCTCSTPKPASASTDRCATRGARFGTRCTGVSAPDTLCGTARTAVGPAVVAVERSRRSTARHRRRAQPPPGEVRRGRRRAVGGQGHARADRRQGVRRPAQARGDGPSRSASGGPGAATRVRHRDPGHPLPRGVLAVPPAVHAAAAGPAEAPGAAAGCDGGPAGGTAPPRRLLGRLLAGEHAVLARRPDSCGLAGRRRDIRGAPNTEPWAAQARPRNHGGERGHGHGRSRRAARAARVVARQTDRRSRTGSRPIRHALGTAARRAGLRLHRPLPRRGHHPPAQRTRIRRRRSLAATGQR